MNFREVRFHKCKTLSKLDMRMCTCSRDIRLTARCCGWAVPHCSSYAHARVLGRGQAALLVVCDALLGRVELRLLQ